MTALSHRSHEQIVAEIGVAETARITGAQPGTCKQWRFQNSIPAPYWKVLAEAEVTSFEELAAGADERRPGRARAA